MWVTVAIVALSTLNSSDLINFLQGKQRSRVLPGLGSRSLLGRGLPGPGRGRGRARAATGVAIGPRPRPGPQPGSCRDLGSPQPGCDWKVAATRPALGPQPGCDWPAAGLRLAGGRAATGRSPRPVKGRSGPGALGRSGLELFDRAVVWQSNVQSLRDFAFRISHDVCLVREIPFFNFVR